MSKNTNLFFPKNIFKCLNWTALNIFYLKVIKYKCKHFIFFFFYKNPTNCLIRTIDIAIWIIFKNNAIDSD